VPFQLKMIASERGYSNLVCKGQWQYNCQKIQYYYIIYAVSNHRTHDCTT